MVLPPPPFDTATSFNRCDGRSGSSLSGFGSNTGMFAPFTQNFGASQASLQPVAHQQSTFGGDSLQPMEGLIPCSASTSASGFGASTSASNFGSSTSASWFGSSTSASGFGSSISASGFGSSTSASGFGSSNSASGFGSSPSASGFGSSTSASGFGASSANYFGASNPTHGSGVNPLAPTSSALAIRSSTAHAFGTGPIPFWSPSFRFATANPISSGAPTFGAATANTANSILSGGPTFGSSATSQSAFGGFSPHYSYNQNLGSRLRPYIPSIASDSADLDEKFISISAMDVYKNKSHEELRLEDYMIRNKVSSLIARTSAALSNRLNWLDSPIRPAATKGSNLVGQGQSNLQPPINSNAFSVQNSSAFPGFQVPFHPSSDTCPSNNSTSPSQHASQCTGTSSSIPVTATDTNAFVNYNTQPFAFHNFPVAMVTFINPEIASYMSMLGFQINPAIMPFGHPTTKVTCPSSHMFSGTPATTGSVGAPSTSSVGLNVPNQSHSTACRSFPTLDSFGGFARFGSSGGQSSVSASVSSPSIVTPTMFMLPPPFSGTQEACKITASEIPSVGNVQSNELDTPVPKGLEIIAEKLGFNPWSQEKGTGNKLSSEVGPILVCTDADKDEDIISLAEFAVEQHAALHKVDDVTFVKVLVACLEPVEGGRYHIVLETCMPGMRFYAVVLRKDTQRSKQMMVLEKWISSKP